jgi:hypothetical protein
MSRRNCPDKYTGLRDDALQALNGSLAQHYVYDIAVSASSKGIISHRSLHLALITNHRLLRTIRHEVSQLRITSIIVSSCTSTQFGEEVAQDTRIQPILAE